MNIKLTAGMDGRLERLAGERGQSRGEVGRDLLERGYLHLAWEAGPSGDTDGDRDLLAQQVDYMGAHLTLVLSGHSQLDPEGAVVAARNAARYLAGWADDRALNAGLLLPAMEGV